MGKWLLCPCILVSKMVSWALVPYHISIAQRASGLPMGGLDSHMSQYYSAHDEARSLLSTEAVPENTSQNVRKSILFLLHYCTTGGDMQLPIGLHTKCEHVVYYLDAWSLRNKLHVRPSWGKPKSGQVSPRITQIFDDFWGSLQQ